jgi:hypothetical protein
MLPVSSRLETRKRDARSARDRATSSSRPALGTFLSLSPPHAVFHGFLLSPPAIQKHTLCAPIKTQWREYSLERYIPLLRTQEVIVDRNRLRPGRPIDSPHFHFPECCVRMPRSYKRRGETSEDPHLACIAPHLTRAHHSYHDDVDDSFEQHCPRLSCLAALDGTRPLPLHDDCGFRWRGRTELGGMDGAD